MVVVVVVSSSSSGGDGSSSSGRSATTTTTTTITITITNIFFINFTSVVVKKRNTFPNDLHQRHFVMRTAKEFGMSWRTTRQSMSSLQRRGKL